MPVGALVALLALAPPAQPARQPAPLEERRLTVGGVERRYLVQRAAGAPAPLVIVFHGAGGSAAQIARAHGWRALAARERATVVFPDGVGRRWGDGWALRERPGVDDFAYVRAVLADVARAAPVDARRTFAVGHSNGAFFAQALACRLPGAFAAIGTVAGQLAEGAVAACRSTPPVSAVAVHGTADPLVPYAGGAFGLGAPLLPVVASAAWRAGRAGCAPTPRRTAVNASVRRLVWTGCDAGRGAELWTVVGGTHAWPGSPTRRSRAAADAALDATAVIWDFFRTHPAR
ncbi:PHB depolymerase family esterase [Roseisolibacter sp. H3M3-2]|uniref:alpha/beta hydrolase family esterase n=1 Tax=Roseisolibacter sp. H3M3-2 TaxID=3031323 RepID=UPI0023DC35B8|nr:PHB depolymerase family esterase [Roseisolibacter sp. H3M3-2]MDF1502757.1 PHB depolymerase family esterase [Roseisolibacter sp. H3M3-2]